MKLTTLYRSLSLGKYVRFPDERLWQEYGLTRLVPRTASFPWAKA